MFSQRTSVVHLNVRSLIPKIEEVRKFAAATNAAVLGITESWLDDSIDDNEIKIEGYVLERNDRNRAGGGVCAYIKDSVAFVRRSDIESKDTEFLGLDILLPKTKPIL